MNLSKDTASRWAVGVNVLFIVIGWGLLVSYYGSLPPEIPLFYSLPMGKQQLATSVWWALIPLVSTATFLMSVLITWLSKKFIPGIFKQLLLWLSVLVTFLGLVAMVHIIYLVF